MVFSIDALGHWLLLLPFGVHGVIGVFWSCNLLPLANRIKCHFYHPSKPSAYEGCNCLKL